MLAVLAAGAALAAPRQAWQPADPLEGVKTAIRLKNFTEAATGLQRLAVAGNAEAQYLLAAFYLNGVSGPRDPAQAKAWLEKSAGQGNARAAFSLANLFAESDPPDPQAAAHWLARARQLGFSAPTQAPGAAGAQQGPPSSLLPAAQLTDPAVRREALWLAAGDGDVPSLEILADPALVSARDEFGRGALARAAEAGSAPAIALLIRRGAAVDAADQHGVTPLMLAAGAGQPAYRSRWALCTEVGGLSDTMALRCRAVAPFSRRRATTSAAPLTSAKSSADQSCTSRGLTLAPAASNRSTTASRPPMAACINAVLPL